MKTGRDTGYRNGVHKTKTNFQTSVFYAHQSHCQHYFIKIFAILVLLTLPHLKFNEN